MFIKRGLRSLKLKEEILVVTEVSYEPFVRNTRVKNLREK
jgi:hypothetical protein